VAFRVEPAEAMAFPDGSFDVVLSSLMMHHLPGDLKRLALVEIRRVLRPGGRLLIIDIQPTTRTPRSWQPGGLIARRHGYGRKGGPKAEVRDVMAELADMLRDAGFTEVESGPTRANWIGYVRGHSPS
jgi:demethylmenaquinone methyltransferase/2-methoxy-6-polyprenyl-1,4-benzoquinol methylase/phosphoethanolamine N-methyltransferase